MRRRSEGTIYKDKFGRWWAQLPADPKTGRRYIHSRLNQMRAALEAHEITLRRAA